MINRNSLSTRSRSLVLLLALSLVGISSTMAKAQNQSIYTNKKHRVTFEPPKGDKPQQTVGGASRGEQCPLSATEQDLSLTPLLPASSRSLTMESHPTMLVYVPETSATTALLAVRDAEEDYDYQGIVPVSDRAGIISVTLPSNAPALDINHEYKWSLILLCDGKLRPDSPTVQGDIMRVATVSYLKDKLAEADLLESSILYGEAGLWYDTVSSLAKLKNNEPENQNASFNWESLLKSVGLENLAKAEFVE